MTAETNTINAEAITERARVLRLLREHETELRTRGVRRLRERILAGLNTLRADCTVRRSLKTRSFDCI